MYRSITVPKNGISFYRETTIHFITKDKSLDMIEILLDAFLYNIYLAFKVNNVFEIAWPKPYKIEEYRKQELLLFFFFL